MARLKSGPTYGSYQRQGAGRIHGPAFRLNDRAGDVLVVHTQRRPLERQQRVAVVADVQVLVVRKPPVVGKRRRALGVPEALPFWPAIDGHPAVPDAAAVCGDAALEGVQPIQREPMLVPPEPQHRPIDELGELLRRVHVPLIERREVLMVAQEDDPPVVRSIAEPDVIPEPFDQLLLEPRVLRREPLDERPADRVVREAEEAGALADPWIPEAETGQQQLVERVAESVHLVVARQSEAADLAKR